MEAGQNNEAGNASTPVSGPAVPVPDVQQPLGHTDDSAEQQEEPEPGQFIVGIIQQLSDSIGEATPVNDIRRAIDTAEFARTRFPITSEEEIAEICDRLGTMKAYLFKATGVRSVIDEAIDLGRQALSFTPQLHPKRSTRLDNLGYSLSTRYRSTGSLEDLEESIQLAQQSLETAPPDHPDRNMYLTNLSARLIERSQQTGQTADLEEAIHTAHQVLRTVQATSKHRGVALCNLTALLHIKFDRTGFRRDLDEALRIAHLAYTCSTLTGGGRAIILSSLGTLYEAKYRITGDAQDLRDSASYGQQSTGAMRPFSNNRRDRVISDMNRLTELYRSTRVEEDMTRALVAMSEAMQEHRRVPYLGQQVLVLQLCSTFLCGQRFLENPNVEDWLNVVDGVLGALRNPFYTGSNKIKDAEHPQEVLKILEKHWARFHVVIEELDEIQVDIDVSLDELSLLSPMAGRIIAAVHEEYGRMVETMNPVDTLISILEGALKIRFDDDLSAWEDKGYVADVTRDIASFGLKQFRFSRMVDVPEPVVEGLIENRREVEGQELEQLLELERSTPLGDLSMDSLSQLSRFYANLYASSQQPESLATAIHYSEVNLNRMLPDDPNRSSVLHNLINLHYTKYEDHQTASDLHPIIHYSEMAFQDPNIDQPTLLSILPRFSSAARLSFQQSSDMEELDKAVNAIKLAMDISPADMDPILPYTLSMTLKTRYQATGDVKNLDRSAELMEASLSIVRRNDDEFAAVQMSVNYALILRLRFLRTHSVDDIDRALSLCRSALPVFTEPLPRLAVLNNLTLILDSRYRFTEDGEDIDAAIEYGEEALGIIMSMDGEGSHNNNNAHHAAILANLANSLSRRFSIGKDVNDIDQAIDYASQALEFATTPSQGGQNSDISGLFLSRYRQTKQREDLDSAILHSAEALEHISESHPLRPVALRQLASCWLEQDDPDTVDDAIKCLNEAFDCMTATPRDRIEAAQVAAKHLVGGQKVEEAALLLEKAVGLMPELGSKWANAKDRQQSVVLCHGLPANAAMTALQSGHEASSVLKTLELGRGIVLGSLMDYRMEIPTFKGDSGEGEGEGNAGMEELIREFNHARMRVDEAEPGYRRRMLIDEMNVALEAIRAQPGYEEFLALPTTEDFMRLAKDGPIIVVLTSELVDPGAAILVTSTKISSIRLPLLTHEETTRRMHELADDILDLAQGEWNRRNQDLFKLLKWLWDAVVAPVCGPEGLDVLQEGNDIVRLRWVGVGVLSKAPFHIAGNYAPRTPNDRIVKYAVSSYAPSLRSLLYANSRKPKEYLNHKVDARILLTKIAAPEGEEPLENVEKEIKVIQDVADTTKMQTLVLDSPPAEEILKQLPLFNLVHFACHAVADPTDPSESHLILSNGRLSVGDIVKSHVAEPDVAFLSACSTAETQDVRLADESIHIASSFLMVGFKHVVGTLWQAPDKICMKVAELFYRRLLCDEGDEWDGRWKVAEALHAATLEAQNKLPGSPLAWGPFVAFGG